MTHTMRALRHSPDLLLNTMDVFVKEPSLDWKVSCHSNLTTVVTMSSHDQMFARKQAQVQGGDPGEYLVFLDHMTVT